MNFRRIDSKSVVEVGVIWAEASNGVIGLSGAIPWYLPEDLHHFKKITADSTVIMGRGTWESLPPGNRPLSGRTNIVLSRFSNFKPLDALIARDLSEALALGENFKKPLWIIGGRGVYQEAIPLASRLELTRLDISPPGDRLAPEIPNYFKLKSQSEWLTAKNGLSYRFESHRRT